MFAGLHLPPPVPLLVPAAQDSAYLERLVAALRGETTEPNEHVDDFEVPMAWV